MTLDATRREPAALLQDLAPLFADSHGSLRELHTLLQLVEQRLAHPVRLAVVGQIKKGKSTLVNALLGRRLAATGPLETTFRVNEFSYGEREAVRAYFRDEQLGGIRIEEVSFDALAGLTVRDQRREEELRDLTRIVVDLPEPLLRSFELIDTPGLFSVYGADSDNTLALLGRRRVDELVSTSVDELQRADAVLYLFSRDLGRADTDVVSDFLGPEAGPNMVGATRAFGVVSKCDLAWPPPPRQRTMAFNPIESVAAAMVRRYLDDEPEIGRLFYDVVPVAGLVAEGAQTIPSEWFGWLEELSRLEPGALLSALRYSAVFACDPLDGVSLPVTQRAQLSERLGPWGILLACRYLRDGLGEPDVRQRMLVDSGVQRVRDLAVSHFGKRAYLIKLNRVLSGIREIIELHQRERSGPSDERVARVRDVIEEIADREQGLWAMDVLRLAGQGRLRLEPDDLDRLYRIAEPGASCAARLSQPEGTPPSTLAPLARAEVQHWRQRSNDVAGVDADTRAALRMLLRTAEELRFRVDEADRLLREADRLRVEAERLLDW